MIIGYTAGFLSSHISQYFRSELEDRLDVDELKFTGLKAWETDDSLIDGRTDAVFLPLEEVPYNLDGSLAIAAMTSRKDCRDVVVGTPLEDLPGGSVVGVHSELSFCTVKELHPALEPIQYIPDEPFDAEEMGFDSIVMPAATAEALRFSDDVHPLHEGAFVPAPGQGSIGILCRRQDDFARKALKVMDHMQTRLCIAAERGVMSMTGAVLGSPIGVNASMDEEGIRLRAVSYAYTDEPRRVDTYLCYDYVMDDLLGVAEYLTGKRDEVI